MKRRGMTLIEGIVVFMIIAIVAVILFPVFARARHTAWRASCQSNLKQLALGELMYAQDHDELLPPRVKTTAEKGEGELYGPSALITPYIKNNLVFACPEVGDNITDQRNPSAVKLDEQTYVLPSYGFNNVIASEKLDDYTDQNPTRMLSRLVPSETLLIIDSRLPRGLVNSAEELVTSANGFSQFVWQPHGDGVNIAFLDGHVRWYGCRDSANLHDGLPKPAPNATKVPGLWITVDPKHPPLPPPPKLKGVRMKIHLDGKDWFVEPVDSEGCRKLTPIYPPAEK